VASWDDLVLYVRMRYEVMRQAEGELWFNLPTVGERTQLVVVRRVTEPARSPIPPSTEPARSPTPLSTAEDGHLWAQIASPVCRVADVDLAHLLDLAGQSVVGGAVAVDGVVVFRHSVPLHDTGLAAFERPFRLVVEVADRLEEELTGADEH